MPTVQLPNGTLLEFPDGMSEDDMRTAIGANFPEYAAPKESGGLMGMLGNARQAIREFAGTTPEQIAADKAPAKDTSGGVMAGMDGTYAPERKPVAADPFAAPDTLGIDSNAAKMARVNQKYASTAAADMFSPAADARARQLVRNGMSGDLANQVAADAAARGLRPGQESGMDRIEKTDFDFDAQKKFNEDPFFKSPAVRGAVKGFEGYKQGVLGLNQFVGEMFGADVSGQARLAKESRGFTSAMGESNDHLQRNFEGAITSIAQQIPMLIGGAVTGSEGLVLGSIFVQSFGQEYSDGRAKGQSESEATTRAGLFGAFEVIGEKFGLKAEMDMLRRSASGVETNVLAKWMANTLKKELPGEMLTTAGQFGTDKLGNGIGLHQDANLSDFLSQMGDTITQTMMQGGIMGGATGGLNQAARYVKGEADSTARLDAGDAQRDALQKWNTNGLSPSANTRAAPRADGQRIEPTWADTSTGPTVPVPPVAPAVRAEPTIDDVMSAKTVDEALAAAQAIASKPIASPYATAADIDALERQAGMRDAVPAPELANLPGLASSDGIDLAASPIPAGERPAPSAWRQAADIVTPGNTAPREDAQAPAATPQRDAIDRIIDPAADWHAFPSDTGTLGIPRADMPQIKAEHRGAMVNFLNARGITHEQIEVPAETFKPTQAEFSLDKVLKAQEFAGGNRSILVSADNYVLDGHHQWLAAVDNNEPVKAIRLGAPIAELLQAVKEFPSATVAEGAPDTAPVLSETAASARLDTASAPAGQRKSTGGSRARDRVHTENPFLGFLATHGVNINERADAGAERGRAGNPMVPGFGPIFRKTGLRFDELATAAQQAGFLTQADIDSENDTGGTRKLADMIERATQGKEVIRPAGALENDAPGAHDQLLQEAHNLGIDAQGMTPDQVYDAVIKAHDTLEQHRAVTGAATVDEQDEIAHYADQFTPEETALILDLDADISLDGGESTEHLTDREINELFTIQSKPATAQADGRQTEGNPGIAAGKGNQGTEEQGDILAGYTRDEVIQKQDAEAERAKALEVERAKLDAAARKERDQKDIADRLAASADNFQLGQSAEEALSGQLDIFGGPAVTEPAKTETKPAKSETPAGNAIDHPAMALANKFDRLDAKLIAQALEQGISEEDITHAVEDHYYMDLNYEAANDALHELIAKREEDQTPAQKEVAKAKGQRAEKAPAAQVAQEQEATAPSLDGMFDALLAEETAAKPVGDLGDLFDGILAEELEGAKPEQAAPVDVASMEILALRDAYNSAPLSEKALYQAELERRGWEQLPDGGYQPPPRPESREGKGRAAAEKAKLERMRKAAPTEQDTPNDEPPKPKKPRGPTKQKAAEARVLAVLGAKVGDTVTMTFKGNVGYLTSGKPMIVASISPSAEVNFKDANKESFTSEKLSMLEAFARNPATALTWEVTPAPVEQRSASEAAKSAAKNAAVGLAAAVQGLGELFGGNISDKAGIIEDFDESKYRKAAPMFQAAIDSFGAAGADIKEVMRAVIKAVIAQFGAQVTANMKPYVVRFVQDYQDGKLDGGNNVAGTSGNTERDSGQRENGEQGLEPAVLDVPGPDNGRARQDRAANRSEGARPGNSAGVSGRNAADGRAARDQRIPVGEREGGLAPGPAESGNADRGGNRGNAQSQSQSNAIGEPATALGARLSLDDKRAEQRAAESVKVIAGDRDNIAATLPFLLEGQRDDVHFAEQRFANGDKQPGVMFTNGTGTGKTYSGLGIAKRFARQGKTEGVIVVPNNQIAADWIKSGRDLGLDIKPLDSTSENGDKGIIVTTYANFGDNPTLADRKWDWVMADEAHYLMASKDGDQTKALSTLQAITRHPDGFYQYSRMKNRALYAQLDALKPPSKSDGNQPDRAAFDRIAKQIREADDALFPEYQAAATSPLARPKAVFLSATPFAYVKSVDYANGYLFEYQRRDSSAYNSGDGREAFFMQHFGYRMRYNKLTQPDGAVDEGLMARQFNTYLKREGALSGRMLDVEADYQRRFHMVESALGTKIDEGLEFIREHAEYKHLYAPMMKQFDYLRRRFLLEAIKATESLPMIREHLALGRKVAIVHDYKKGGAFNPFQMAGINGTATEYVGNEPKALDLAELAAKFRTERSDLVRLEFPTQSALQILTAAFPDALVHNGDVPAKQLELNKKQFNADTDEHRIIILQSDKGREGISLHDTTGRYQRVEVNIGMPSKPTALIQLEGRIYRTGQSSDAIFDYVNTGTMWERWTFAQTIAERADTAEALAMGDLARGLKDSIIEAFEASDAHAITADDGKGGKARDRQNAKLLSEWDRAKSFYFGQQKKTSRNKAAEGKDYFATPEPLGLKMVEWADIRPGEDVAEPSAGHGAIARWLPVQANKTIVEPSTELITRARLVVEGEAKFVQSNFEDLHIVNKYDAIVMNPPFGVGGSVAIPHLAKAYAHLRDGGRIVAIIPTGPAADAKFDKFLYGDKAPKDLYLITSVALPGATFGRAGTGAMTRIVILDKVSDASKAPDTRSVYNRDFTSAEDIGELFDELEHMALPGRVKTVLPVEIAIEEAKPELKPKAVKKSARAAAPDAAGAERFYAQFEFKHTKTEEELFGAAMLNRVSMDTYKQANAIAKENGGWYNKFAGGGAQRGFLFKSADERATFMQAAGQLDEVGDGLDAQNSRVQEDTPAFKAWFGDSKVVDEHGAPMVMYHGTNKSEGGEAFTQFDTYASNYGLMGQGGYFTADPAVASSYTAKGKGDTPSVYPVYLAIKNPLDMEAKASPEKWKAQFDGIEEYHEGGDANESWYRAAEDMLTDQELPKWEGAEAMQEGLRAMGHDGITHMGGGRVKDDSARHRVFIAFDPEQIKSATGNGGNFDGSNPDIMASRASTFDPGRRQLLAAAAAAAMSTGANAGDLKVGKAAPINPAVLAQRVAPAIEKILRDGQAAGTTSLNGTAVLRKAMKAIALTGPKEVRALAALVEKLLPTSGTIALTVDDTRRMNVHGVVELAPFVHLSLFTAEGRTGLSYETVLHEALHVAVAARYRSLSAGMVRGNDAIMGLSAPQAAAALKQFENVWEEFRTATAAEKFGNQQIELAVAEARGNPDEFFVRTLTDPVLQAYMAGKQYEGKTLWARFKDWVKSSLFGFSKSGTAPSWLDAALAASSDVAGAMGADKADFSRMAAISRAQAKRENSRVAGPDTMESRALPDPTWTDPEMTRLDNVIHTLQDKQIDMRRVVQAIRSEMGELEDKWNPYLQEELFHGRSATGFKDYLHNELRPLLSDMQARGVTMEEFEEYLHMRHAEEANVQVASINPDMPDKGSGIATKDARDYLANQAPDNLRAFEALAQRIDAMTAETQRLLVDYSLEKQDTIDAWNATYQNYVPLFREDMDAGTMGTGTGQGYSVRGSSSKRRMGSERAVVNIIANIAMARERAIVRGEKNRLDLALYGLALKAPNPEFWRPINPMKNPDALAAELDAMGLSPAHVVAIIDEPRQRVIDKQTGLVVKRLNPLLRSARNVVAVRVNGEDRFVFFNEKNERAMRMAITLKNMGNDGLNRFLSVAGFVTRQFAAINTQYNPIFGLVNLTRDTQEAAINLTDTPIAGRQHEVIGEAARLFALVVSRNFNLEKLTGADAALWHEFQQEGGITGFRAMFGSSDDRAREIAKEMKRMTAGPASKPFHALAEWLSNYNEALENITRMSVYKTAKAHGLTNQQSASLAKSLTVNFNRKGAISSQMGSLYAFFNAAVQGTARMAQTLTGPAGKKIIAGGLLLGVMQAVMMAAAGYDDEDPPEFVKERNVVIPLGWITGKKNYLTIPMPLGFSFIPTLGRLGTEFGLRGGKNAGKFLGKMAGSLLDAFNPLGSSTLLQTIAPTGIDPLAALAENRDWTGKPISRNDLNGLKPTPGYTRAKDTASGVSKTLAYYLNAWTGGTKYTPGALSPTPDQIDYLLGTFTGGVGREILKTQQTVSAGFSGEELPTYKIPLAGRFYGNAGDKSSVSTKFYANLLALNIAAEEVTGRAKDRANPREFLNEHPEARLADLATAVHSEISQLRKYKQQQLEKGDKARVKEIELRMRTLMENFNSKVDAAKQKAPA